MAKSSQHAGLTLGPTAPNRNLTCGLVMPISALDGCSAEHWLEVKAILSEAVEAIPDPCFDVKLVSDADEIGVIQKRIVQNVYSSDILICDVSGKNPNVMFELGMRLAFDKATVIVKDDKTDYSFDTGIIEHLTYPRDLRFSRIVDFKKTLATKVTSTYKACLDSEHSPFLRNFGQFHVASLTETEVSADKLVLDRLDDLRHEMALLRRRVDGHRPMMGSRERSYAEGINKVASYIQSYLAKDDAKDPTALLGDEEFYRAAVVACDAAQYFPEYQDFKRVLDSMINAAVVAKPLAS